MRPTRNLTRPWTNASVVRGSVTANDRTSSTVTIGGRTSSWSSLREVLPLGVDVRSNPEGGEMRKILILAVIAVAAAVPSSVASKEIHGVTFFFNDAATTE